jgi:hypothetical protein
LSVIIFPFLAPLYDRIAPDKDLTYPSPGF